jgi:Uncharacterized ACR, COG1430
MKIIVFRTAGEKKLGLQNMTEIPADTIYVFVAPLGGQFHSRNVPEPFDILFLSPSLNILGRGLVTPPDGVVAVPLGAAYAVEAKVGVLDKFIK